MKVLLVTFVGQLEAAHVRGGHGQVELPADDSLRVVVVVVNVAQPRRLTGQKMLPVSRVPQVPFELRASLRAVLHVHPVVAGVPDALDAEVVIGGVLLPYETRDPRRGLDEHRLRDLELAGPETSRQQEDPPVDPQPEQRIALRLLQLLRTAPLLSTTPLALSFPSPPLFSFLPLIIKRSEIAELKNTMYFATVFSTFHASFVLYYRRRDRYPRARYSNCHHGSNGSCLMTYLWRCRPPPVILRMNVRLSKIESFPRTGGRGDSPR
jgi:hypothetical protein